MDRMIFLLQPADEVKDLHSPFNVIENFPYLQFVTDEEGNLKSFDDYEDALTEAMDCQNKYVISFHTGKSL